MPSVFSVLSVTGAFALSGLAVGESIASFKQIGAPASDVARGWLVAPTPESCGAVGRCRQIAIVGNGREVVVPCAVPPSDHLAILPIGEDSASWTVRLQAPDGEVVTEGLHERVGTLAPWGVGDAARIDVEDPAPGTWHVSIGGIEDGQRGLLMLRDEAPIALRSTRSTWHAVEGRPFTLTARFEPTDGQPRRFVLVSASARLLGGDSLPSQRSADHVLVPLDLPAGQHTVWIDAVGVDVETGARVERSVLHTLVVERDAIEIGGDAHVAAIDAHRVALKVPCAHTGSRDAVLAGAEVWTTGDHPRCVAWIGGLVPLDAGGAHLTLDTRWLTSLDGAVAPIELRSVRLADRDSVVLLGRRDAIAVGDVPVSRTPIDVAAQRAMRMGGGNRGGTPVAAHPRAQAGGHNLMLVHGYCSDGNSWPSGQFSGDVSVYLNANQNFSHDAFALDIHAFGSQFKSYGIAGHSQGGSAALHLYSFYWSGRDWATPAPQDGGRLIQGLGGPFEGTALAGNIAALGEIFGVQCGANYDMTYDGAAYWLSFVPGWARGETWSWTTTFTDDWWSWDYCHVAADLVLSDPEDGVVEAFSGDLDGTNFMGLKEGWCHIEDMTDPAQTLDTSRNNEINVEAAR